MSVIGGPRIINDGLILNLDVSNSKSYPGSGTVWTDLAQGLIFNSTGTVNPYVQYKGVTCLHFNGSGYWDCDTDYDLVDLAGDCTLEFWFNSEDVTTRKGIFEKRGTTYASYQQELACTYETSEYINFYTRYDSFSNGGSYTVVPGTWNQIAYKLSTGKTTAARRGWRSLNGSSWSESFNSRSTTPITPSTNVIVGNNYAGTMDNGFIAMIKIYNRLLNDAEILENYNAAKERFGL